MKLYVKVIIIIVVLLLAVGAFVGYNVYKMVMGSEEITGQLENVPTLANSLPPLTKDSADWPHWRGARFDGKSATTGIITDWSNGLKKLWEVHFLCQGNSSASWGAPVVQGNRLVVPGRDEKNDLVFCINTADGKLIWTGSYKAETETSHGPGARATPFIDNDRVYTFGRGGDLACWQLADGKLLWHQNVMEQGGKEPRWGHSATPLVFGNNVIVQGGGNSLIIAYDKMTGAIAWKSMQGEAGYAASIPVTIENDTLLLVYHGMGLSCVNATDGKELWRVPWETQYGVNATTPVIVNNVVFHSSGYGMGGQAIEVRKDGYKVLWKCQAFDAQHSDPVVIDGYIYGYFGESVSNKGLLKCVELATGKEKWSTDQVGQGTLTYVDGYLVCLDLKGNLFLVKPDPLSFQKTGEIKEAMPEVKNLAWTVPVVANGKLYLRYLQNLVCFSLVQ